MSVAIRAIIEGVIEREGGYVDHPDDRGGPTMYGITEIVARDAGYGGRMQDLPRDLAVEIYEDQYVRTPGFHRILPFSEPIAERLIDCGVNMGPMVAGRFLQRCVNVFNLEGKVYRDIVVDGMCGPQTAGALHAFLNFRVPSGEAVMLEALRALQSHRYIEIAEKNPSQEAFAFGWFLHRILGLS